VVIGFSFVSCGDGGGGNNNNGGSGDYGSGGGPFTLTNIPSQYNGMYAYLGGTWDAEDNHNVIIGWESLLKNGDTTLSPISGGTVNIPLWKRFDSPNITAYTGNDKVDNIVIQIWTGNSSTAMGTAKAHIMFNNVTFTGGKATKSWNEGTVQEY